MICVIIALPAMFVTIIFGWMLLIGGKKDRSNITLSGLGLRVSFTASKGQLARAGDSKDELIHKKD